MIESDAPIIVSQYLVGGSSTGTIAPGMATGDPAQVIMPLGGDRVEVNNFNSYPYLGGGQARALVCE